MRGARLSRLAGADSLYAGLRVLSFKKIYFGNFSGQRPSLSTLSG